MSTAGFNLEVTDDALKSVIREAIFSGITQEQRDKLIQGAITSVLNEQVVGTHYGDRRTKLQMAFESAISGLVHEVCKDVFTRDSALREKITGLVIKAFDEWSIQDELPRAIAEGISHSFKNRR